MRQRRPGTRDTIQRWRVRRPSGRCRRHTVPSFAAKEPRAWRQRRERRQIAAFFNRRPAANAGANVHGGVGSDPDRRDHDLLVFQIDQLHQRFLADGHVVTDVEEVPAALQQVHAPVDMHALADSRAERAQCRQLEHGAFHQPPGHQPQRLAHDPVLHVERAPDRCAARDIGADEQRAWSATATATDRGRYKTMPAAAATGRSNAVVSAPSSSATAGTTTKHAK